ncbi:TonB C-terminal domain-containing protein [Ketobacter sp.]|uniref:TonB C-terminal domain-containing protein n=1 Tax=Ketobacter sp. TaxID=2083498 RepID=UPI000F14A37C|nr:TonB C-terminal domain-containing protein [Ketobacter sp.]RLU01218.1 MAG: hypothetical protein D9N14_03405 [Ketobacter sp.]
MPKAFLVLVLSVLTFSCSSRELNVQNEKRKVFVPTIPVGVELIIEDEKKGLPPVTRLTKDCGEIDDYMFVITTKIYREMEKHAAATSAKSKATFSIRMKNDGLLSSLILIESSGSPIHDYHSAQSIKQASPYLSVPESCGDIAEGLSSFKIRL